MNKKNKIFLIILIAIMLIGNLISIKTSDIELNFSALIKLLWISFTIIISVSVFVIVMLAIYYLSEMKKQLKQDFRLLDLFSIDKFIRIVFLVGIIIQIIMTIVFSEVSFMKDFIMSSASRGL